VPGPATSFWTLVTPLPVMSPTVSVSLPPPGAASICSIACRSCYEPIERILGALNAKFD
jgi:hypothetical protein